MIVHRDEHEFPRANGNKDNLPMSIVLITHEGARKRGSEVRAEGNEVNNDFGVSIGQSRSDPAAYETLRLLTNPQPVH